MTTRTPDPASVFAESFVEQFGIESTRHLEETAGQIGLEIRDVFADGYEGLLLRVKGRPMGIVALSRSVRDRGRRLFTLAHEIGHYVLPTHAESAFPCRRRDIENWEERIPIRELEANRFAAALLMPKAVISDVFTAEPSFGSIEEIADRQGTSLTASAYRYVELSGERVAIVWSESGMIRWAKASDEFYRSIPKQKLDPGTYAARLFRGLEAPDVFDLVPATSWLLDKNLIDGAQVLEHSKMLGGYGVLTLLWIEHTIENWRDYDDGE